MKIAGIRVMTDEKYNYEDLVSIYINKNKLKINAKDWIVKCDIKYANFDINKNDITFFYEHLSNCLEYHVSIQNIDNLIICLSRNIKITNKNIICTGFNYFESGRYELPLTRHNLNLVKNKQFKEENIVAEVMDYKC
jgi:hypothetical protein